MCLTKSNCQVVCTVALTFIVVRIEANRIKSALSRVSLNVEEDSFDKINEVVVVDHFEPPTFITWILTVHQTLVKEEHRIGVAGCGDGVLAEASVPPLQVFENLFHGNSLVGCELRGDLPRNLYHFRGKFSGNNIGVVLLYTFHVLHGDFMICTNVATDHLINSLRSAS